MNMVGIHQDNIRWRLRLKRRFEDSKKMPTILKDVVGSLCQLNGRFNFLVFILKISAGDWNDKKFSNRSKVDLCSEIYPPHLSTHSPIDYEHKQFSLYLSFKNCLDSFNVDTYLFTFCYYFTNYYCCI